MSWNEIVRFWNTTERERQQRFPCDRVLPHHNDSCYRALTILAEPRRVFPWLCQLRVAPYSYDWIDNLGRRSPRELTPELQNLELGQRFMSIFELADFEPDVHVTLQLRRPGLSPPLAVSYVLDPHGAGACRLVVKLVLELRPGLRDRMVRALGPSLDWIMMRRQLLNLKALAERSPPQPRR
jgi:hypothetical protein